MVWTNVLGPGFLAFIAWYTLKLRIFADWDKQFLYRHAPGPCVQVLRDGGSEDLTHMANGVIIISQADLLGGSGPGKFTALDVNGVPFTYPLNITNAPNRHGFMFNPHGVSTWKDPKTGQVTVFVVTHPPDADRVEMFEYIRPGYLKHIRTVADHKFRYMNNIIAVDKDKFYITQFMYYRSFDKYFMEPLAYPFNWKWDTVMFYDGSKVKVVADNLFGANGINVSPDKSTVYVAEWGAKKLIGYQRKANNDLTKMWEMDVGTGLDNIEVDPTNGDLWLGCHPVTYAIMDFFLPFFPSYPHPSQVLKVKMSHNMVSEIIEVYADPDGSEARGSSVATYVNGKVVIGTVFDQTVVCDSKYIM